MLKVLELFAGIGACSEALERLGIDHEIVDAVEIDKYAIKSFNAVHGTNFEVQDITKWDKNIEVDLVMHGSPCQDFSLAGKQAGGDLGSGTRSSLMYETIRIVGKLRPKFVIWENVKNLLSSKHKHNFEAYLETMKNLGYTNYYQVLDAKDYGIPQHRERVFTVSILGDKEYQFPEGNEMDNKIKKLFNFSARQDCRVVYDAEGLSPTLVAGMGAGGGKVPMFIENFKFPEKEELKIRLKDILENEVDEKYYLSDVQVNRIKSTTYNVGKTRIQEKEYCDTLCARDWKDPKCVSVNRIGGIFDTDKSKHQAGSIYDKDGLAPSIDTMQGGYRQPMIEVIRNYSPSNHDASRIVNSEGIAPTVKENHGTVTATNVEQKFIEKHYENFKRKKGYIPEMFNPYNESEIKEIAPTQSTSCGSTTSSATVLKKEGIRIRKLTPKECWRLMGFDDEDFEKARAVGISNTQLYKQAGNSIVVNVLEKILEKLL